METLRGRRVVVTAGGTREPIDPVRYLGNRSSGKMGNALARAAASAGADVWLITTVPAPADLDPVRVTQVETAEEMHRAVVAALQPEAVLIMAAAVADYRPATTAARKIKKSSAGLTLELVPTTDILVAVSQLALRNQICVVGFAAETDDPVQNGRTKLHAKQLDLCVINDVSRSDIGMGADDNAVTIVAKDGDVVVLEKAPKAEIASSILGVVASRLRPAT